MKVAILGGGITGLTLARLLRDKSIDYHLYEAAPRLGGLCRSEIVNGFTADCAGGHIIFSKHREVMDFILGALGEGGTHESERKSAIWYEGNYVQYPFENGLADLPKQDNFECLKGYVEADFARRNGAVAPDNFKDWCRWRFGDGISEKFMHPYNEKIWKTDLEEMSTRWVAGRVPDAPVEDVLRSSIGIRTEGYKHQSIFHYPLEGGFERIIQAIAAQIDPERVSVGIPVSEIRRKGAGWEVNGTEYDKLINTIPLRELCKVLDGIPEPIRSAFDRLQYTGVVSVLVAVDAPPRTDRSWIYFPHPEAGPFNRITHLSNYSPRNAPEGKSSLMAEVTYRGEIDTGEALQAEVVDSLVRDGLVTRKEVIFTRAWKNKYAYILYTHDLEENLERVRAWLADQGIDLLGRFGNYDYFNSDMCIKTVMDYVDRWAD